MSDSRIAQSIHTRLLQGAKKRGEEFNFVLSRYASERFLYRLCKTDYKERFVLKGATLFAVWNGNPHRATKDLDLLGHGENEVSKQVELFKAVCRVPCEEDGIKFDEETVKGQKIKEDQQYEGIRIELKGKLGSANLKVQIDIGFGDSVVCFPEETEFPSLLNLPSPWIKVYPLETVVAEKFQAMVFLGMQNSRLKDFYDIWFLTQEFEFQGNQLARAIQTTFERRNTLLPQEIPVALKEDFFKDENKCSQWSAFLEKGKLKSGYPSLEEVVTITKEFVMPPSLSAAQGQPFDRLWLPQNFWLKRISE